MLPRSLIIQCWLDVWLECTSTKNMYTLGKSFINMQWIKLVYVVSTGQSLQLHCSSLIPGVKRLNITNMENTN